VVGKVNSILLISVSTVLWSFQDKKKNDCVRKIVLYREITLQYLF